MAIEMSDDKWASLQRWAKAGSQAIYDYLMLCVPIFEELQKGDQEQVFVYRQLAVSCHLTSESALLLIEHGCLWDAEILIRSVTEGTAKFAFMAIGTCEERAKKVKEYWIDLP